MSTKKKVVKRQHKKRGRHKKTETVIIIESTFDPKDTLFPEKVARAKERLRNADLSILD